MDIHPRPPIEVIAYTAGVLDGEGSISRPGASGICVQLSQSDHNRGECLCNWFRDQWGLGKVLCQSRTTNLGIYSTMWIWQVNARRDCLWLLQLIQPYLIVKRERADALIPALQSFIDDKQRWTNWTNAEDAYLVAHAEQPVRKVAATLNRSREAVQHRRRTLGIVRPGGRNWRRGVDGWTAEEDQVILDLYSTTPTSEIAARLGRTVVAVLARASYLRQSKGRGWRPTIWNEETDRYVRANYKTMSYAQIGEYLGVSGNQVKLRAHKLGLFKKKRRKA